MISEKLSSAYTALEDKYFNLLDALDHRGIPVYAYSDFFEDKGIPSFIVTIAIIVAIILLLSLAFTGPLIASGEITLNIRDSQTGQPLQNITLSIYTSNDLPLSGATNLIVSDGDKINIASLPTGTKLTLSASIDGYQPIQKEIMLGSNNNPTLNFDKAYVGIPVTVKLYNSETNTKIVDAVVSARYDTEQFNFFKDSNGSFRSSNIPEGEIIILTIASEGYNDLEETVSFFNGQEKSFFLTPSDQGYVDKSSLIVTVSNETGNTIENAEVTIYNKNNQTILLDTITEQGAISGLVQTNVPIRITVKKDGYLFWDSDVKREGITLIKTEEKIDVILEQGGEELTVNVVNSLGLSLSNAVVQVFNENGERMFREVTTTTGATFTGLDPNSTVIITASRESYLPNQIIVDVGITESVPIILSEAIASNSARLDIFTLDEFGDPVNGANIKINFFKDTNKIPYGLDDFATSVAGYVSVIVGLNNSYEINAETNVFEGKKLIDIGNEIVDNKVYINMKRKPDVIEMKLLNIYGGPIYGTATIDALDGTELYDGNISNSRIFFDALGKDVVELRVKTEDGNIFTENVLVSENYVEVIVYDKGADALKPSIEFVGFETETGKEVQGITPGAFYWAKFNVVWPIAAQSGGIHIRTGKDDSTIVDEDKIALFELSLPSSTKYYSYSYNPLPAPGNEILDRSNQSFEGETSKWVEGVVKNPKGSYTAKVRVRASDFTAGKLSLKYRAWSSIQDEYYRNPEDNIIGNDAFNEEKAGLYANTNEEEIVVYESLPECSDELCVAFNFVDDSEVYRDLEGFEALKGRVYALEAEFSSQQTDFLQVNISTDSNIVFIGTQVSNFNFLENNGVGQNNASTTISLTANGKQRARFYFVANSTGTNVLNFVAAGNNAIEKTISFNSAEEGQLIVELSESTVMLGRNFTVRVLDSGLRGVENALVKILDKKGEVVKSMSGEGTDGRGKNGNYRIENDLGTGLYIVQVSAPKYLTQETNLLITTTNVLSFADEINVKMLVNEKQKIVTEKLTNNSDFTINDIIVDVENSENFKVSVVSVPLLGKQQSQALQIMVEFIGERDEAEENITLNIKGLIEGKFLTQISSVMNVSYNRKLDSSCLKMEPSSLKINLIGSQGSSDSDTIEVTNNCDQPVFLQNRVKENTKRSFVVVTSEDISLQPGQTSDITITANNLVERQFARNESYGFSVIYDSNYLTKTLNVTIELINPSIALSYPGQVTLFLAQDRPTGKAIAAQPIFVTNVSQFPVEGISFSVDKAEYSQGGNVKITVEPPGTSNLEKGQSINPPKLVFGEASSKASEPTRAKISIRGRLGQLNNRVGQRDNYNNYLSFASGSSSLSNYNSSVTGYNNSNDLLGVIDVIAYYSGLDCLKVSVVNSTFNLSAEGLPRSATISVQNDCAEPVRITEANIKSQDIVIGLQSIVVMPGTLAHANISILANRGNVKLKNFPVIIRGITETSQTLIEAKPFNINVFAGVEFNDEYSKATKGISVNVCGQDTKETIDVPRDSSDCSNGYCDAEQAAEYIAKKLDQAIRKAESQAYSAQNTNESMACLAQGYCSFDQIGTQVIDFGLYMKNDDLSVSVLEDAFDKISSGSTGFNGLYGGDYIFQRAAITDEFLGEIARFGLGRQVFIDEDLSGCGYYNLSINGAFPVTGEGVAFTIPTLTIRVAGGMKIDTKECKNSIENLVNFTPVDEGYSLSNTGGTWLTSINAENSLKNMATQLSSKLLKSETRVGEGNGNKIILKEGALAGSLAEVCLQDGKQKIINVTVASSAKSMNETERKAFENQVAKMVSDTIKGSFGENCLVKNSDGYSCVKLTDVSGIGKLKLELDSKELPLSKSGGCVSGEISSNVPEGIEFEIITDNKDKKFSNITKIVVSEDKENGEKYFEINFQGDTISK